MKSKQRRVGKQCHVPQRCCRAAPVLLQISSGDYSWVGPNYIADRAKIAHAAGGQLRVGGAPAYREHRMATHLVCRGVPSCGPCPMHLVCNWDSLLLPGPAQANLSSWKSSDCARTSVRPSQRPSRPGPRALAPLATHGCSTCKLARSSCRPSRCCLRRRHRSLVEAPMCTPLQATARAVRRCSPTSWTRPMPMTTPARSSGT